MNLSPEDRPGWRRYAVGMITLAVFVTVVLLLSWLSPLNWWQCALALGTLVALRLAYMFQWRPRLSLRWLRRSGNSASLPPEAPSVTAGAVGEAQETTVTRGSQGDITLTQQFSALTPREPQDFSDERPPPNHRAVLHIKHYWKGAFPFWALGLMVSIGAPMALYWLRGEPLGVVGVLVVWLAIGGSCLYFDRRAYILWQKRPWEVKAEAGMFVVHQWGRLRWLASNSEPDYIPIDGKLIVSPKQTFWEQLIPAFHSSQTLVLRHRGMDEVEKSLVIRDFVGIDVLRRHAEWRETIDKRSQKRHLDETRRGNALKEEEIALLRDVLTRMSRIEDMMSRLDLAE